MKRTITTAVPPSEIMEILLKSGAKVEVEIRKGEPFHGMPRWEVVVDGRKEEVEKFMLSFMRSRAGG